MLRLHEIKIHFLELIFFLNYEKELKLEVGEYT